MVKQTSEITNREPAFIAIGRRVAEERARLQISREELARRAGLSAAYVWRVEDGRQNLQLRNLLRIAQALQITVAELMLGLERMIEAAGTVDPASETPGSA